MKVFKIRIYSLAVFEYSISFVQTEKDIMLISARKGLPRMFSLPLKTYVYTYIVCLAQSER